MYYVTELQTRPDGIINATITWKAIKGFYYEIYYIDEMPIGGN